MTFYPVKLATRQECAKRVKAAQKDMRTYQIQRLLEQYHNEPDREYADAMWGSILREMDIDPTESPQ